jgi:hypothetical protein
MHRQPLHSVPGTWLLRGMQRQLLVSSVLSLAVHAGIASAPPTAALHRDAAPLRALIWLYDCSPTTLAALANHSRAFTALAPPMYAVGFDNRSHAVLTDIGTYCAEAIHNALPGKEIWAWVESPDSMNRTGCPDCAEDAVMRELFARPEAYIASAKAEATKHNLTGFQFDFEAPGQAVNANRTMWLQTLRFHEQLATALAPQGVLTSVCTMCTANITDQASVHAPKYLCGNGPFNRFNASADPAIMQAMADSAHVQRFVSMGTYSTTPAAEVNQVCVSLSMNTPCKLDLTRHPFRSTGLWRIFHRSLGTAHALRVARSVTSLLPRSCCASAWRGHTVCWR